MKRPHFWYKAPSLTSQRESKGSSLVAARNTNGDGTVDIADGTYLLNFLFLGGPAPVEPFGECGTTSLKEDEELGCETRPRNCP